MCKKLLAFVSALVLTGCATAVTVQAEEEMDNTELYNTYVSYYCVADKNGIVYHHPEHMDGNNCVIPQPRNNYIDWNARVAAGAFPEYRFAVNISAYPGDSVYDEIDKEVEVEQISAALTDKETSDLHQKLCEEKTNEEYDFLEEQGITLFKDKYGQHVAILTAEQVLNFPSNDTAGFYVSLATPDVVPQEAIAMINSSSPASAETTSVLGDVDGDGETSVLDVISVNRYILGKADFSASQIKSADVDKSGIVDSADALLMMKKVVGIVEEF